jgi:hypothetical protein
MVDKKSININVIKATQTRDELSSRINAPVFEGSRQHDVNSDLWSVASKSSFCQSVASVEFARIRGDR